MPEYTIQKRAHTHTHNYTDIPATLYNRLRSMASCTLIEIQKIESLRDVAIHLMIEKFGIIAIE